MDVNGAGRELTGRDGYRRGWHSYPYFSPCPCLLLPAVPLPTAHRGKGRVGRQRRQHLPRVRLESPAQRRAHPARRQVPQRRAHARRRHALKAALIGKHRERVQMPRRLPRRFHLASRARRHLPLEAFEPSVDVTRAGKRAVTSQPRRQQWAVL